ncbi:hypothetical protein SAMN05444336_101377 [Albimonas donghaensis]|uniref:Uncharacterized protein n=1 Tax=Albimonas donghaensis TaxID=356660 RepID=A0A1H2RIR4_9RHOB|nr:hypothetical protein [Albimonas donghaensis]SDW19356.1 hypothetical protein SAMN05444336_101377 [Albimonas donghaensis]
MITRAAAALSASAMGFVPAAAFAHAGPEGHAHPHGIEVVALAAIAVAAIWAARRALR